MFYLLQSFVFLRTLLQAAPQETPPESGTAYDSVWANLNGGPVQADPLEEVMLADDKLFVVLTVVLIIWLGIAYFIVRTDRKLDALEDAVAAHVPETELL